MPEEFEVDPGELAAEIREHQRLTGTEPEEAHGLTRRDEPVSSVSGAVGCVNRAACERSRRPPTRSRRDCPPE